MEVSTALLHVLATYTPITQEDITARDTLQTFVSAIDVESLDDYNGEDK